MRDLAREGIIVLTRDGRLRADGSVDGPAVIRAGGLDIAGFPDPLEWRGANPGSAARIFSFGELDDGEQAEERAKRELADWFDSLPEQPDVVMVHQNGLAQHLAQVLAERGGGEPLTIVTGHDHLQHLDRYGAQITVVDAGSAGAGGLLGVGREVAGLGRLHFAGPEPQLDTVGLIRIEPLSGQAGAERIVVDLACPAADAAEEPCHYEPSEANLSPPAG
jgi:hypothetical protein